MSTVSSPAALPKHIETLLSQRSSHVAAIAAIDATLTKVSAALGHAAPTVAASTPVAIRKTPGRKPGFKFAAKGPVGRAPAKSSDGLTSNEFVIQFIKSKKNPTGREINAHWIASGRKGNADNNLSLLTKAKELKRMPLEGGQRGSRYTVA